MKLLKTAFLLSVVLYMVCIGILSMLKAAGFNQELSTPEMFYGPALTIVSLWIIIGPVYFLFERNKNDDKHNG